MNTPTKNYNVPTDLQSVIVDLESEVKDTRDMPSSNALKVLQNSIHGITDKNILQSLSIYISMASVHYAVKNVILIEIVKALCNLIPENIPNNTEKTSQETNKTLNGIV